jgi:ribonuclease HII
MSYDYLIGIDEAGRGPLAGPVAVGAALVAADFDWSAIPGVGDSKQVSPKKRAVIFAQAEVLKKSGILDYAVVLVSAKLIDKIGIVPAIKQALSEAITSLVKNNQAVNFANTLVKLDGGLKAPIEYVHQATIIKGDAKEKVIGLASIMAKVTRDHYMEQLVQRPDFAIYNFAKHKGYGTKDHRELIKEHGLSKEHRQSFCRNIFSNK